MFITLAFKNAVPDSQHKFDPLNPPDIKETIQGVIENLGETFMMYGWPYSDTEEGIEFQIDTEDRFAAEKLAEDLRRLFNGFNKKWWAGASDSSVVVPANKCSIIRSYEQGRIICAVDVFAVLALEPKRIADTLECRN